MPRKGGYLTFRVSTWYIKVSAALCIALWHRRANRSATCCSTALNIFEGMFQSVGVLYWGSTCCTQLQTGHRVQELCAVSVQDGLCAQLDGSRHRWVSFVFVFSCCLMVIGSRVSVFPYWFLDTCLRPNDIFSQMSKMDDSQAVLFYTQEII